MPRLYPGGEAKGSVEELNMFMRLTEMHGTGTARVMIVLILKDFHTPDSASSQTYLGSQACSRA
jgi:hypothetical protein